MFIVKRLFIILAISSFLGNLSLRADWYDNLLSSIEKEQTATALGLIDQSRSYIRTARLIDIASRKTLLHEAAIKGLTDVVKALIQAGANIQARDNFGYTPLDRALMNNHLTTARAILDEARVLGIDLMNNTDRLGFTPLQRAVIDGNGSLVRFLIGQDADPRLRGAFGTPLEIALEYAQRFPAQRTTFIGIANDLRTALSARAVTQLNDLRNLATESLAESLAAMRQATNAGIILPAVGSGEIRH